MQTLTENAIIHLSAGFEGPFLLQAFGVRKDTNKYYSYHFCLTDGVIYIGATYESKINVPIENYSILRIRGQFQDRFHPMYLLM
jgi:hypothetical protein